MKDATEIVVVLDRSGSMGSLTGDTIGTFNGFLKEQQALPGEARMTLVLFNTVYSVEYLSVPIAEVPELDSNVYVPGGFTALLDAVGNGIDSLGLELSKRPESERPDKVIFVIITDGLENESKEYNLQQVREKVEHQQKKYKWQFLFLGAGIDAFGSAEGLGINRQHAGNYSANTIGTRSVGRAVGQGVEAYRKDGVVSMDWNKELK